MSTADYLKSTREKVDKALQNLMPAEGSHPARLVSAMRYSLFAGGKRIRPILVLAAAAAAGGDEEAALQAACAVELVHTYSLIHDDLPAMDDDDLRRGRPTCHKVYDEGTAILAGDALLTMAFDILSARGDGLQDNLRLRMVQELSRAAGWKGMVGGQQVDMDSEGTEPDLPTLEYIHTHKTGALIRCCMMLGGLSADADEKTFRTLSGYGEKVGLAFQVVDDILDVTASTEEIGKNHGSDAARGKVTYPGLYGLAEARERAMKLVEDAKIEIAGVDATGRLAQIADYVLLRRL